MKIRVELVMNDPDIADYSKGTLSDASLDLTSRLEDTGYLSVFVLSMKEEKEEEE